MNKKLTAFSGFARFRCLGSQSAFGTKEVSIVGVASRVTALLWQRYGRLRGFITRKLPNDARGLVDAEDIVQEVHVEVFRTIRKFEPHGEGAFYRWLTSIARLRVLD